MKVTRVDLNVIDRFLDRKFKRKDRISFEYPFG
mgnify:CR=1 FL=1